MLREEAVSALPLLEVNTNDAEEGYESLLTIRSIQWHILIILLEDVPLCFPSRGPTSNDLIFISSILWPFSPLHVPISRLQTAMPVAVEHHDPSKQTPVILYVSNRDPTGHGHWPGSELDVGSR